MVFLLELHLLRLDHDPLAGVRPLPRWRKLALENDALRCVLVLASLAHAALLLRQVLQLAIAWQGAVDVRDKGTAPLQVKLDPGSLVAFALPPPEVGGNSLEHGLLLRFF